MKQLRRCLAVAVVLLATMLSPTFAVAAPSQPAVVGSISNSNVLSGALAVAVSGHYAYTTSYWSGRLAVIDFSNPSSPALVGYTPSVSSLTNGSTVNIAGNYAFVVSKNRNGPCLPGPVGNCNSGSNDDGTGNALTVIDISNPTNPTIVGQVQDPNTLFGSYGVAVSGHYAYIAYQGLLIGQSAQPDTSNGGFSVIDLNNLAAGVVANIDNGPVVGGHNYLRHATSVAISGNYAYVTAFYDARITVIDISNPLVPVIVASLRDATNLLNAADVTIQGNYAFVADQTSSTGTQFTVVNVANPLKPAVVAGISNPVLAGAYRIRVRGNFAYLAASGGDAISAIDISTPSRPRLAGWVQSTSALYDSTGLDVDPTGRYVISSSPLQGGQVKQTWPAYPLTTGGPVNTGSVNVIDMVPTPIAVTIDPTTIPANPTTSTSAGFGFSVSDAVSTVQCSLDGAALGPCTSATTQQYSLLGTGSHTFTVQATDPTGATSIASYTWTVGTVPQNSTLPTVSGSPSPTSQLSAAPGSWSGYPAPTFSYQWRQCDQNGQNCTPISGQTGSTYLVQQGDVGSTLSVVVTATNSLGSSSAVSSVTPVVSTPPSAGTPPSVSGQATVGGQLTGSPGSWSGYPPPTLSSQWQRCDQTGQNCRSIAGATGSTYSPVAADAGSTIVFQTTGSNPAGTTQAASQPTSIVTQAPQNTVSPGITGTPTPGQTLSATPGSWSGYPAPSFSFAWQQCDQNGQNCAPIPGQTGSTYAVQSSDSGLTLAVMVTALNSVGSASRTSSPTGRVGVAPANVTPPTISGTAALGQTLTATPGTWSGYPQPGLGYQWQRCAQTCAAIIGATNQSYGLTQADVGFTILATVTGTNGAGQSSASSAPSATVTGAPSNTSAPSVSGSVTLGGTVSASPGQWSAYPAPTFTYVWQRCGAGHCATIAGATAPTYVAQRADVGSTVAVTVTASNSIGSSPASSAQSTIVTGPPMATQPPVVSGTVATGNVLTSTTGTWSGYPTVTLGSFQWKRCSAAGDACVAIVGATSTSYTVTSADLGSTLRFTLRATNSLGSATVRSGQSSVVNYSGILHGPTTATPTLSIGVDATTAKPVSQLTISPPHGISFQNVRGSHVKGLEITDAHGARLLYMARISHGALTITLARHSASLRLGIGSRVLSVTRKLIQSMRGAHPTTVAVKLTSSDFGKLTRRVVLKLRAT